MKQKKIESDKSSKKRQTDKILKRSSNQEAITKFVKRYKGETAQDLLLNISFSSTLSASTSNSSNRILTYLRATMSDERLSALAIISINNDIVVNIDEVLKTFIKKGSRRIDLKFD